MKEQQSPPIKAEIQVDANFTGRVEAEPLRSAAVATARHEQVSGPAEVTVVITGDARMRRLNRTYLGLDRTTDVLSFGGSEGDLVPAHGDGEAFVVPTGVPRYLGDVIISFPQAEAQARRLGHPVAAELQLLVVHGVLHLLGHDHDEPQDKAAMWSAQAEILQELGAPAALGAAADMAAREEEQHEE